MTKLLKTIRIIMKKIIASILFMPLTLVTLAQSEISGIVVDQDDEALPFANVSLLNAQDSTIITNVLTDERGAFAISDAQLPCIVSTNYLGFEKKSVTYDKAERKIIKLSPSAVTLNNVEIVGKQNRLKMSHEGLLADISNTPLQKIGTAEDVLSRMPMIFVKGNSVEVFGKGKPLIYINSKEINDYKEVQQLSSDDIKSVELITNPSAKYDASYKAVIKIKTKKPLGDGWGGVLLSQDKLGENPLTSNQFNLKYRRKNWEIFSTAAIASGKYKSRKHSVLLLNDQQNTVRQDEEIKNKSRTSEGMFTMGANYNTEKRNFGVQYSSSVIFDKQTNAECQSAFYVNETLEEQFNNKIRKKDHDLPTQRIHTYYGQKIGKAEVQVDLEYYQNHPREDNNTIEKSQLSENRNIDTYDRAKNELFAGRFDVEMPLWKGTLNIGTNISNTDRKDKYDNPQEYIASSDSKFKNRKYAFYAGYNKQFGQIYIAAYLRYEHLKFDYYEGNTLMEKQSKIFANWFPSLSMSWPIGKMQFQFSYTSKIKRPYYDQLSDNTLYVNRYCYKSGNPFLKNTISHDVSLGAAWKILNLNISYTHEKDPMIDFICPAKPNSLIALNTQTNVGKADFLDFTISLAPQIGKFRGMFAAQVSKPLFKLDCGSGQTHSFNKAILMLNGSGMYVFTQSLFADFNMKYVSKGNRYNNYYSKSDYLLSVGITKSLMKNRLTLRLSGEDLLNKELGNSSLFCPGGSITENNRHNMRCAMLTIRYSFNPTNNRYKAKRTAEDEVERM